MPIQTYKGHDFVPGWDDWGDSRDFFVNGREAISPRVIWSHDGSSIVLTDGRERQEESVMILKIIKYYKYSFAYLFTIISLALLISFRR